MRYQWRGKTIKTIIAKNSNTGKLEKFERVSRWIAVNNFYGKRANKNNSLFDYVTDENGYKTYEEKYNPTNGIFLDFFRYNGRKYAVNHFYLLQSFFMNEGIYSFTDTDGKTSFITTVDMDGDIYHPLYAEWDEYAEKVRLYKRY